MPLYSMLCNLCYPLGHFICLSSHFHKPSNCSGQHSIVNIQPKRWYLAKSIFLYHSVNVQRAHHLLGGIVLNAGRAVADHMPQIWRWRPTGLCVGSHPLHVPRIGFCTNCRIAMEAFYFNLTPFFSTIVKYSNPMHTEIQFK